MRFILILFLVIAVVAVAFPDLSGAFAEGEADIHAYRPVESWTGEKLVFHTKPVNLRGYDYINLSRAGSGGEEHPTYQECVGRIGTVTDVEAREDGAYLVCLKMEDDGTVFTALVEHGYIEGLVSMGDVESAGDEFTGKRFWYLRENILSYNEDTNYYEPIYAPRYSALEVIRVEPGWSNNTPVRLVLGTSDGEEGYVEVNLSGTNVPWNMITKNRFWYFFSDEDPKKWSQSTRKHIDLGMVHNGMTRMQAQLSWGAPYKTEKLDETTEKWTYAYGDSLIFKDDKLVKRLRENAE